MWDYLGQLEAKGYPYDICAIQHSGYLTDNAPPSTRSCEMVKRWNEKYEWPKLRSAVATDFIKTVERDYAGQIPSFGERGRTGGRMVLLPEHAKRLFPVLPIPMRLPGKAVWLWQNWPEPSCPTG